MFNFVRANLYKAMKSKTFAVLMSVSSVCCILMVVLTNGIAKGTINASFTGISFLVSDASILALLGAMLASTIIGAEFESKWFHHAIVAGYSRLQIVIGKLIVYLILFSFVSMPYVIGAVLVKVLAINIQTGTPGAGVLSVVNSATDESLGSILFVFAMLLVVYAAQVSLTVLLAFTVKKAMLIIPIFYFVSAMAGQVSVNEATVPTVDKLLNFTPFGSEIISLSLNVEDGVLFKALVVSLIFIAFIIILTFISFRKAELK